MVLRRHVRILYFCPTNQYSILDNSNVLGKLPIRDSNNRVNWKLLLVDFANTINT